LILLTGKGFGGKGIMPAQSSEHPSEPHSEYLQNLCLGLLLPRQDLATPLAPTHLGLRVARLGWRSCCNPMHAYRGSRGRLELVAGRARTECPGKTNSLCSRIVWHRTLKSLKFQIRN